jgi:hypothetical protein
MSERKKKMKKVYKHYKQEIRAFTGLVFGALIQVSLVGVDAMLTWDKKRWIMSIGVAMLPGIVGWMKGGDSNPTDEELYEKVQAVKKVKETQTDLPAVIIPPPPAP